MNTLVLGYGNPLRGDDGVGWVVVERLQGVAGITAVPLHQLLPEHADMIHTAVHVIFVDAAVDGEPGAVRVQPLAADRHGLAASHQMSPGLLLAMVAELYGRCPPAHLLTITGQNFGYTETLSSPVQESVRRVIGFLTTEEWSAPTCPVWDVGVPHSSTTKEELASSEPVLSFPKDANGRIDLILGMEFPGC